jgi:hypothetical protein
MIGNSTNCNKSIYVPKGKFTYCLSKIINQDSEESSSNFFKKLHFALAYALDKPISNNTLIVHGATNGYPERFDFLRSGFRNIWNILMVREPVIGHYARIRHWYEESNGDPEEYLEWHTRYMSNFYLSQLGWENCTKAVKTEDLHHSPKETLNKIINWISIPWDNCLLQSTFLGINWLFQPNKIYIDPFNKEIISIKKYTHLFTSFDHYRIAICFRKLYSTWNYEFPNPPHRLKLLLKIFSPFKIERLAGSKLLQRLKVRKMIFIQLLNLEYLLCDGRFVRRYVLYKLFGKHLMNRILRSTGRKIVQERLSKSIIELL